MFESITVQDIDQEWAWSQLVGRSVSVGKRHKYCSPLRADSKPGVWFEYHKSILLIIDFSDKSNSHINCVTAWSRVKGIHWRKALYEIYDKQGVRIVKKIEDKVKEKEKTITITECWTKEHEKYCQLRGLTPEVREGRMYGVSSYTIHSERTRTYLVDELCFGYKYSDSKWKIYLPNNKTCRFISNLKANEVFFRYVNTDKILIQKSIKDYLESFSLWNETLTHVQSENTWEKMVREWSAYKSKIIWFDGDRAGLINGYKLAKKIGGFLIFVPNIDALSLANKMEDDFFNYLPSNLKSLCFCFNSEGCNEHLHVNKYPLLKLSGLKDLDDLVCNNEINQHDIFSWLIV